MFKKVFQFYYQGFRSMTWGRKLWLIILVKLFIMFAILRVFFFRDFLSEQTKNNGDKGEYVIEELIERKSASD